MVLLCWLFLLAVSALSPVGGQVPRNIDIKVDVSNIDELYQALLGQASEILVDNNILAGEGRGHTFLCICVDNNVGTHAEVERLRTGVRVDAGSGFRGQKLKRTKSGVPGWKRAQRDISIST